MIKLLAIATQAAYKWARPIPATIMAVVLSPVVAIAGTEFQKFADTRSHPDRDETRLNMLPGRWGVSLLLPCSTKEGPQATLSTSRLAA
jgi:hypothetical protein